LGQFWALHLVSSLGGASLTSVARHLSVSAPTACASVDPLVDRGLLARRRSATDRRAIELRLTPRGQRIEARVWAQIGVVMDEAVAGLPPGDVAIAVRVFRTLRDRLDAGLPTEGAA
ncbi:Bacterial regulatory protein, MarR, partial [mine drainage metagenome]